MQWFPHVVNSNATRMLESRVFRVFIIREEEAHFPAIQTESREFCEEFLIRKTRRIDIDGRANFFYEINNSLAGIRRTSEEANILGIPDFSCEISLKYFLQIVSNILVCSCDEKFSIGRKTRSGPVGSFDNPLRIYD